MTRAQTVVRGAALSGGSIFVSMGAMLVVGKLITNALEVEWVGVYALLLAGADFVNLAGDLGMHVALPKLVAAAPAGEKPRIIAAGLGYQLLIFGVISVLFFAVWWLVPGTGVLEQYPAWGGVWPYLWLMPFLFTTGVFRDVIMSALAGCNRYGARAGGIIVSSVAQVGLVYVGVWRWEGGLVTLALVTAASYGMAVALMAAGLPAPRRPRLDGPVFRRCVAFSWPLYVNQLLTFCYQRLDTILVTAYLGVSAAAVYEMIKRFPTLLSRVLGSFLVPYLPNVSELIAGGDRVGAARLLDRGVRITALVGYGGALCAVVLQEALVRFFFTAEYLQGLPVLGLLLAASCMAVQTGLMGQTLIAMGHPGTVTSINIGLALLGIVGNVVLLPRFGLVGGGYAAVLGIFFSGGLQAYFVHRRGLLVRAGTCLKPQVIMAASLGLCVWGGLAGRMSGLVLFVVLSLAFSVVRVEEIRQMAQALRPQGQMKR